MTPLRGTEEISLEVGATLDADFARTCLPADLSADREDGAVRGSVLLFRMRDLRWRGFPPGFDYVEALWRIGVRHEGELGWYAVACDIDHPVVRLLGARVVRYPTRAATLVASEGRWRDQTATGSLVLRTSDVDKTVMPTLRRVFVGRWEIPWNEDPPASARSVRVIVEDRTLIDATFGRGARLDAIGVLHRGRTHMCGRAVIRAVRSR